MESAFRPDTGVVGSGRARGAMTHAKIRISMTQ